VLVLEVVPALDGHPEGDVRQLAMLVEVDAAGPLDALQRKAMEQKKTFSQFWTATCNGKMSSHDRVDGEDQRE